jgi:squalene-associated FAD-dependent desaturase
MRIAIAGGGYAGMAAAVTASDAGAEVTVFEAAATLGGRARRVDHRELALDNGLHILVGAYTETLRLIEHVTREPVARRLRRTPLDLRIDGSVRLRRPDTWLPPPLHLAATLLLGRGLSMRNKLAAARLMRALARMEFSPPPAMTVAEFLDAQMQPPEIRRALWEPLCVAALNTGPAVACARTFAATLRDTLAGPTAASDLLLPTTDLTALFPEPAARYLASRGATIRLRSRVETITMHDGAASITAGGIRESFDRIVVALPPHRAGALLRDIPALRPAAEQLDALRYEPIHSIYLQYAGPVRLEAPMLGFTTGTVQWLFDREALCGQSGLLGAVISASSAHLSLPQEALAKRIDAELRERIGPLPRLSWHRVIAEKRATFSCRPLLDRPGTRTNVPGMFLAGDHVASEYPATLEAAVRSGIRAATLAMEPASHTAC